MKSSSFWGVITACLSLPVLADLNFGLCKTQICWNGSCSQDWTEPLLDSLPKPAPDILTFLSRKWEQSFSFWALGSLGECWEESLLSWAAGCLGAIFRVLLNLHEVLPRAGTNMWGGDTGVYSFHRNNNNNNDFYLGKGSGFFSLLSLENSAVSRCSLSMFLPAVPFPCFLKALLGLFFSKQHLHSCFWRVDFPAQPFLPQQQASSISSPCKMGILCPSEIMFCGSLIADLIQTHFLCCSSPPKSGAVPWLQPGNCPLLHVLELFCANPGVSSPQIYTELKLLSDFFPPICCF